VDDKLVTIAQFTDYIEAEMAKQLLADYKIEAVVSGDNAANVYSIPAVAEVDLQVLESQAKEAVEILESRKTQEQ
jgi:hypothetical protein